MKNCKLGRLSRLKWGDSTRGRDEVIGKSSIWLKLYLVKLLNISRKVSKRVLQNMNKEKKILMVNGWWFDHKISSFVFFT